jgi:hypothetical protein
MKTRVLIGVRDDWRPSSVLLPGFVAIVGVLVAFVAGLIYPYYSGVSIALVFFDTFLLSALEPKSIQKFVMEKD